MQKTNNGIGDFTLIQNGATALLLLKLCEADKPYERRRVSATRRGQLM
jgi:hypothetical protein